MSVQVLQGDCRAVLTTLPAESVQTCITSPPYWRLRDYGVADQIGLEETLEEYISELVSIFRAVRRVLRKDGTLWLNLGDRYSSEPGNMNANLMRWSEEHGGGGNGGRRKDFPDIPESPVPVKRKDLLMLPARVALALQADGWWLRSDLIWEKPTAQPESVRDRPSRSHEYLFLLSKSECYFYDSFAIREPASTDTHARGAGINPKSAVGSDELSIDNRIRQNASWSAAVNEVMTTRNKRSVWRIPAVPFRDAHFAVFPEKLVEPCILAGTSEKGCCAECGAPWKRTTEQTQSFESGSGRSGNMPVGKNGRSMQGGGNTLDIRCGPVLSVRTVSWEASCRHDAAVVPCTVLDPFVGSGTTLAVALKHRRGGIGIELNPDYCALIEKRLTSVPVTLPMGEAV